ncbi:MAG TPA: TetR/AcrR family transcriptional regulator C-terminal domain-containing protein, partial [Bdellovibrio sp.]
HVENKDDLIDGIIEEIINQIALPDKETPWREALLERAISEYQILSAHSWIIHLLESRSGTGQIRLHQQNHMIGILRRSGFPINLAFQTMIVLTGYVYGFVVFAKAWSPKSKERTKTIKKAKVEISPETHPYVLEAVMFAQSRNTNQEAKEKSEFEFGLRLLLDGIATQLKG